MLYSALFALALTGAVQNPCDLASQAEIVIVLGGSIVDVPPSERGEETAPGCLWATHQRVSEVKFTVWSEEELPVLDMPDAGAYFLKLRADATAVGRVTPLAGVGERAFVVDLYPKASGKADGSIVVLKKGRVFVFDFTDVLSSDAQALAVKVISRL